MDLSQFKSVVPLKTHTFEVMIDGEDFTTKGGIYVVSCSLPDKKLKITPVKIQGYTKWRPTSVDEFDVLSINFRVTNDLWPYFYFNNWMDTVVDMPNSTVNYIDIIKRTVMVKVKDITTGDPVCSVQYYDCVPVSISKINLDSEALNTVEKFQVDLRYSNYKMSK